MSYHFHVPTVLKFWILDLLEPSGPYINSRLFGCTTLFGTPATCTVTQFVLCLIHTSGFVLGRRAEECKYMRIYCERYFSSFDTTVTVLFVWYSEYILSASLIIQLRICERLVSCLLSSKIVMPKKKKFHVVCNGMSSIFMSGFTKKKKSVSGEFICVRYL